MCYLVAKDRNAHGCFALKTTHGKHLVELKRELNKEVGYKGVQLVTISRPTAYGKYAPYHFVDIYLVGAKSLGAYGGYETFVYKLTEYHQNKENIKYHVACKANGDGCMDESKFEGVTKINDHEFELHNAHCFKIDLC